jgi:hypothetical protein
MKPTRIVGYEVLSNPIEVLREEIVGGVRHRLTHELQLVGLPLSILPQIQTRARFVFRPEPGLGNGVPRTGTLRDEQYAPGRPTGMG